MSMPQLSSQFFADEGDWWSRLIPDVAMLKHPLSDIYDPLDGLHGGQEAPFWDQDAPIYACQPFEELSSELHQGTCNINSLSQYDSGIAISHKSDPSVNRSPESEVLSPAFDGDFSSPSTISSVSRHMPTELDTQLQFIQYRSLETRKTCAPKRQLVGNTQPKKRRDRLSSRPDALKTDRAPKTIIKLDLKGRIAGTECVFGLKQAVRAPTSSKLQLATTITRRLGACSRCRRQRIRCDMPEDLYQPCGQCVRLSVNLVHRPCIQFSILDLNLHRKGSTVNNNLEVWLQAKLDLQKTSLQYDNSPKIWFLTQDRGEGFEDLLSVTVSRFEPRPGDKTGYDWEDSAGQHHTMEMPPYFISDIEAARRSIREFSQQVRSAYIETLLAESNPIVRQTFQVALAYSAFGESTLISDALQCWVVTRFIERSWRVLCGGPMAGLKPTNERGNPFDSIIPVTPVMDTQLDDLVLRDLLIPLSKRLLKNLKAKIDEQKKENWLEIYLTVFIMMSNMGWVMKDVVDWTSRHGLKTGHRGGTLTQGFIHTCKTMLAYFHFACNGSVPLSLTWPEVPSGNEMNKSMTRDQIQYLGSIQKEISRQDSTLAKWKDMSMYEDEMYWCSQMLCSDWRGDIPYAGEIDDFTEQDFLTS